MSQQDSVVETASQEAVQDPSCEDLDREAAERPKSLRLLPRITLDALPFVWAAAPRPLIASIVLKLINGRGGRGPDISKDLIASVRPPTSPHCAMCR